MVEVLLTLHSVWRWVVLLLGLGAVTLMAQGIGSRGSEQWADRVSLGFVIAMDVQVVVGVLLWLLQGRWSGDLVLSWLHPFAMLIAVALAHVGRARSDASRGDAGGKKQGLVFFGASLAILLLAIPIASWPL